MLLWAFATFLSYFFPPFVKRWVFSRTCVCAGEGCAGIAQCTLGWRKGCWAHLSDLLPVQLSLGPGGPRPGLLRAGEPSASQLCAGPFCPCFEAALHYLGSLSWSLQHFLPILAQIHKVVCTCLPHRDKSSFSSMESQLYSHLSPCRCLLTGSLLV